MREKCRSQITKMCRNVANVTVPSLCLIRLGNDEGMLGKWTWAAFHKAASWFYWLISRLRLRWRNPIYTQLKRTQAHDKPLEWNEIRQSQSCHFSTGSLSMTSSGKMTTVMYSNLQRRSKIWVMGLDLDFFIIQQIPTTIWHSGGLREKARIEIRHIGIYLNISNSAARLHMSGHTYVYRCWKNTSGVFKHFWRTPGTTWDILHNKNIPELYPNLKY